jgi:hypothetical protein
MPDAPILDYIEAAKARDAGMASVLENERAEWRTLYRGLADYFLNDRDPGCVFTGEDLRLEMVRLYAMPAPHHPNAWGAMAGSVIRDWLRCGLIEQDGMAHARSVATHAHRYVRYRVR